MTTLPSLSIESRLLAIPFLLLTAGLTLTSMAGKSPTIDEEAHLKFGIALLTEPVLKSDMQRMPATALNAIPVLLLDKIHPDATERQRLFAARTVTVVLSCVLAWFVYLWSRQLWGASAGLLSLGLYSVSPNLIAHARWVTNDIAVSLFLLLSVLSFLGYLRKPAAGRLILSAVLFGCAQLSKQSALILGPILIALACLSLASRYRKGQAISLLRSLARASIFALIVVKVINAGYLFKGSFMPVSEYRKELLQESDTIPSAASLLKWSAPLSAVPVPLPWVYIESLMLGVKYNEAGGGHGPNYLLGELSREGWWYYFLVALAYKLPLATFLLFFMSIGTLVAGRRNAMLADWALLLVPVCLLAFMSTTSAQIGIRYVIPIIPFLLVSVGRLMVDYRPRHAGYKAAILASIVWLAISSSSYYPHYLSYFNELVGRRLNMYHILADSNVDWHQNDYLLADYLSAHSSESIHVNPPEPTVGKVIVNINRLVGVEGARPEEFAWLRETEEPVGHIGYSWLIFEVSDGMLDLGDRPSAE